MTPTSTRDPFKVVLKKCAVPDCDHEFPGHYFRNVCSGTHDADTTEKYGNLFDKAAAGIVRADNRKTT